MVLKVMLVALVHLDSLESKEVLDHQVLLESLEKKDLLAHLALQGLLVIELQKVKMECREVLVKLETSDQQEIQEHKVALVNQAVKDPLDSQVWLDQKAVLDFQEQLEHQALKDLKALLETLDREAILVQLETRVLQEIQVGNLSTNCKQLPETGIVMYS